MPILSFCERSGSGATVVPRQEWRMEKLPHPGEDSGALFKNMNDDDAYRVPRRCVAFIVSSQAEVSPIP
jgi:hypothetical protein